MKRLTLLLTLLMVAMAASAQQYLTINDIPYSKSTDAYAQERCKLDVYYPTDLKDCPVVVWFMAAASRVATSLSRRSSKTANWLW